jgi:hypothetical protein
VATLYENYGLRITESFFEPQEENRAVSGNLVESGYETDFFRIYNFRKPDMFNRLAINKIRDIHKNLFLTLKNRHPQWEKWSLISLDEESFSDSFDSYNRKDCFFMSARDKTYGIETDHVVVNLLQVRNLSIPCRKRYLLRKERAILPVRTERVI